MPQNIKFYGILFLFLVFLYPKYVDLSILWRLVQRLDSSPFVGFLFYCWIFIVFIEPID